MVWLNLKLWMVLIVIGLISLLFLGFSVLLVRIILDVVGDSVVVILMLFVMIIKF